jgi:hypothetical protein
MVDTRPLVEVLGLFLKGGPLSLAINKTVSDEDKREMRVAALLKTLLAKKPLRMINAVFFEAKVLHRKLRPTTAISPGRVSSPLALFSHLYTL